MLILMFCLLLAAKSYSFPSVFIDDEKIEIWKGKMEHFNLKEKCIKQSENYLNRMPNPIKKIDSKGRLRGDPIKEKTLEALEDMKIIENLYLSYLLSNDISYRNKIAEFVIAWINVLKSDGDPINDTKIEPLLYAIDMIKKELSFDMKNKVDGFLLQIIKKNFESFINAPKNQISHNFHSHRLKIIGMCAFLVENEFFIDWAKIELKNQLDRLIDDHGKTVDFVKRNALHYHCYTLEPLLKLNSIFYIKDKNFSIENYQFKLQKSIAFLSPYLKREIIHHEFEGTKVPFDLLRSANKEPHFIIGVPFDPKQGLDVLFLASCFENELQHILNSLLEVEDLLSINAIYFLSSGPNLKGLVA